MVCYVSMECVKLLKGLPDVKQWKQELISFSHKQIAIRISIEHCLCLDYPMNTYSIIISRDSGAEERVSLDECLRDLHEGLVAGAADPDGLARVAQAQGRLA